jgi:hypothetical protein
MELRQKVCPDTRTTVSFGCGGRLSRRGDRELQSTTTMWSASGRESHEGRLVARGPCRFMQPAVTAMVAPSLVTAA